MNLYQSLTLITLFFTSLIIGQNELPLKIDDSKIKAIPNVVNHRLQNSLEQELNKIPEFLDERKKRIENKISLLKDKVNLI